MKTLLAAMLVLAVTVPAFAETDAELIGNATIKKWECVRDQDKEVCAASKALDTQLVERGYCMSDHPWRKGLAGKDGICLE